MQNQVWLGLCLICRQSPSSPAFEYSLGVRLRLLDRSSSVQGCAASVPAALRVGWMLIFLEVLGVKSSADAFLPRSAATINHQPLDECYIPEEARTSSANFSSRKRK
jgi:hypothetical protein